MLDRLSVVSMLIIALLLICFFTVGLNKLGVIKLPHGIGKLFGDTDAPRDDETNIVVELPEFIIGNDFENAASLSITEDEYLALLESTPETEVYSATLSVSVTHGDTTLTRRHMIWQSKSKYRAETYDSDGTTLLSVIICDGRRVSITDYENYDEPVTRRMDVGETFTLENQLGIPSPRDFIGRDDIENLMIDLVRTASSNFFHVTYNYIGLSQVEEFYISLDHRLILSAQSHAFTDGKSQQVYSLSVVTLSDKLDIDGRDADTLFKLNN